MRNLFLNGLVMFFPTVTSQFASALLFCFFAVCFQLALDPFKNSSDNIVQASAIVQLYLTLFGGFILYLNQEVLQTDAQSTQVPTGRG